jgi:hypothetical protein
MCRYFAPPGTMGGMRPYPLPPELRFADRIAVLRAVHKGRAVDEPRLHEAALQYARHRRHFFMGSDRTVARRLRLGAWLALGVTTGAVGVAEAMGAHAWAQNLLPPALLLLCIASMWESRRRAVARAKLAEAAEMATVAAADPTA